MLTTSLTSKGRISLPAKVRSALGVEVGDRLGFVELKKGTFLLVAMNVPVRQLQGSLAGTRKVSIEEMNPLRFVRNYFRLISS
jgi:AbrB family looped-hinge helix DNA binding protein